MTWQRRVWLVSQDDGLAFFELRGDRFVRDEALRWGIQRCDGEVPGHIVETPTDSPWFVEDHHPWSACPPPHSYLRRYQSGVWIRHGELHAHWLGIGTFKNGTTLVAEVPYRAGPPWGYSLRVFGNASAPTPRRAPKGSDPGCYTEVDWPIALFSSSDGEALIVGQRWCRKAPLNSVGDTEGAADPVADVERGVAERFRPHQPSIIEVLPVALDSRASVIGSDPRNVWLVARDDNDHPVLVASRGDGFAIVERLQEELVPLRALPDGTIFALRSGSLMRRDAAGTWSRIPLPSDSGEVIALDGASSRELWLTTEGGVYATRELPLLDFSPRECSDAERVRVEAAASDASRRAASGKMESKRTAPPQVGCREHQVDAPPRPFDPFDDGPHPPRK